MRVIGILGGMGPQATIDLYQKIINNTPARIDQEHLQVAIWSDPTIPDRTAAILKGGQDPVPQLASGVKKLLSMGADCIAMPCNTAHYFLPKVAPLVPQAQFLNMIELTVALLKEQFTKGSCIAITGTSATLSTELYQAAIKSAGLEPLVPDAYLQSQIMDIIFGDHGVKAGYIDQLNKERYAKVVSALGHQGAAAVIAGCTELPLVVDNTLIRLPVVDPTDVLAKAAVDFARQG